MTQELLTEISDIIDRALMADMVDGRIGSRPYAGEIIDKLKSLGWKSPEEHRTILKREIKNVMKGTRDGMLEVGYVTKPARIVCLCGSTRFVDTFNEWRKILTLEGKIVLSIELVLPQTEREDPQHSNFQAKKMLDELHLRKIDLADEVMILNVGGYIGESTTRELKYAVSLGKSVKFLEQDSADSLLSCLKEEGWSQQRKRLKSFGSVHNVMEGGF